VAFWLQRCFINNQKKKGKISPNFDALSTLSFASKLNTILIDLDAYCIQN